MKYLLKLLFVSIFLIPSLLEAQDKSDVECQRMKKSGYKFYKGCGLEEAQTEEKSYGLKLSCHPTEHLGATLGEGHPKEIQGTNINEELMADPFQLNIGDRTCKYIFEKGMVRMFALEKSEDEFYCKHLNEIKSERVNETRLIESTLSVNRYNGVAMLHTIAITVNEFHRSFKTFENKTKLQCEKANKKF